MKKTHLFVGMLLTLVFLGGMTPVSGFSGVFSTEETIEFYGVNEGDSFSKIAIISQPNEYANLWLDGDTPAQIDTVNENGGVLSSITSNEPEQYPRSLTTIGYASTGENTPTDPWDQVKWLEIDNITDLGENTPEFTVNSSIQRVANITTGGITRIDFPYFTDQYHIIDLSLEPGVYMLYFGNDDMNTGFTDIMGPNGTWISIDWGAFPDGVSGGNPIRSFGLFAARMEGIHRMYFIPTARFTDFELVKLDTIPIIDGDSVEFKESGFDEMDPVHLIDDTNGFPIQVYEISGTEQEVFTLDNTFPYGPGGAKVTILNPTPLSYGRTTYTLGTNNLDRITFNLNGTAYYIIYNEDYFEWVDGVPVRNILYYNIYIDRVASPIPYTLGSTQDFTATTLEPVKFYDFTVTNATWVVFNFTTLMGTPVFNLPNSFRQLNDNNYVRTISYIHTQDGHHLYHFEPGTYYGWLYHSQTTTESNIVRLQSRIVDVEENMPVLPKTLENQDMYKDNKTTIAFADMGHWNGDVALKEPVIVPFEYNWDYYKAYNISLCRKDNPGFQNASIRYRIHAYTHIIGKNDDLTAYQTDHANPSTTTLAAFVNESSNLVDHIQFNNEFLTVGLGEGFFSFWPYDIEWDNGTGWEVYNKTINFRVGLYENNARKLYIPLDTVEQYIPGTESAVNYTTVDYDITTTLNLSQRDMLIIPVNGDQKFDWWDIKTSFNTTGWDYSIRLYYENVWKYTSGPSQGFFDEIYSSNDGFNNSFDLGIALDTFYLVVEFENNPNVEIELKFSIKEYNLKHITSPEIPTDFSGGGNFPGWVVPTTAISSGAIILAIGVVFIRNKKKNAI